MTALATSTCFLSDCIPIATANAATRRVAMIVMTAARSMTQVY